MTFPRLEELEIRSVPALLGNQLFPADSPWNQKITNAPVAANSTAIINNIIANQGSDGRLHPDFGEASTSSSSPLYGIPYNVVHGNSVSATAVKIDAYANQSDVGPGNIVMVPLPAAGSIRLEGDFQNAANPTKGYGSGGRGDSHLIVYDVDNNVVYEFFFASRPSENGDGMWHADSAAIWDLNQNTFRPLGYTSADAAGLPILTGLVRPDELAAGVITHPIRMTLRNAIILNEFLYPASHTANPGNTNDSIMPPMGARFRLKASVDISGLDPQSRIVAQAMKDYGLIVADNGSNFYFTGASYSVDASNTVISTWNDEDIQSNSVGLKSLNFSDFEVVDLTPVVTGVASNFGSPAGGNTVVISGLNFSGAAGNLHVFFGDVEATVVAINSDSQLTVIAPPHPPGLVDVRVQSGSVQANGDPPPATLFFGYGTSAVTPASRYNYGDAPPPPAPGSGGGTGPAINLLAVGADAGGSGVKVYNSDGSLRFTLDPFPGFTGGIRVATGDVTGDGVDDIIVGVGPGDAPRVAVFDGASQARLVEFLAFEPTFLGGVYLASGDFDGDGKAEVVVTPDEGGGPVVAVYRGAALAAGNVVELVRYLGIDDPNFRGGARAAVGDVNGDGTPDIVVSAGFLGGPRISIWDGTTIAAGTKPTTPLANFFAFEDTLRNGTFVAVGDVTGDGKADLILGGGPGGGPRVRIADADKLLAAGNFGTLDSRPDLGVANFFSGTDSNRGGVRLAVANLDGDNRADVITGSGPGAGSRVTAYAGASISTSPPPEFLGFDAFPGFPGGVFVG